MYASENSPRQLSQPLGFKDKSIKKALVEAGATIRSNRM